MGPPAQRPADSEHRHNRKGDGDDPQQQEQRKVEDKAPDAMGRGTRSRNCARQKANGSEDEQRNRGEWPRSEQEPHAGNRGAGHAVTIPQPACANLDG